MDWQRYKRLCDSPAVFSRWALETTKMLTTDERLASELDGIISGRPLAKPRDHRGGLETDCFEVRLEVAPTVRLLNELRSTPGSPPVACRLHRHLVVVWQEYLQYTIDRQEDSDGAGNA